MSATHDLERRMSDHYATEAPSRAPDRILVQALDAIDAIPQRRIGLGRPWTVPPMTPTARLALVALALLAALLGGALLVGAGLLLQPRNDVSSPAANGWIAFTVGEAAPGGQDEDLDIWFVALDQDPRRVVGTETDAVQQLCPAFSPDGRSLAYGRVEGHGTRYVMNPDGTEGFEPAGYRQAVLVVADVSDEGVVSDRLTIDVGDGLPPPCPVWSPDAGQVAFGADRTSPINPETSAAGSEVWVVTLADRGVTVLPDLLATDLEWSPDGRFLAIASGEQDRIGGGMLHDGRIVLHEPASGVTRSLDGTTGVVNLTWSPDGGRIAWAGQVGRDDSSLQLRVIDVESGGQQILDPGYRAIHGIGPVWAPDGKTIAYQKAVGGERHEVVLVTPGDPSDHGAVPEPIVIPSAATATGSSGSFYPWHVTWSPDSKYLLYLAWESGDAGSGPALVAVPADLDGPSVLVVQMEGIVPNDGYPDTTHVPIHTWGRSPTD